MGDWTNRLSMVFDVDKMMFTSITENLKIKKREIDEIIAVYYLASPDNEKEDISSLAQFFIPAMIIKGMVKSYQELKQYYFQNSKETTYSDMEILESENKTLIAENSKLKSEVNRLKSEYKRDIEADNVALKREIETLKDQLEESRQMESELYALREAVFDMDYEFDEDEIADVDIPEVNAIIVGGHENWHNKLRDELPDTFKYLEGFNERFDIGLLDNVDYVLFFTGYMNHSVYYKAIDYCRKHGVNVGYLKSIAVEYSKQEIEKIVRKNRNNR